MKYVLLVLLFTGFALADDHLTFRGAYVGEPLSDFIDCSSKPRLLKDGYKSHGKLCEGRKGTIYRVRASGFLTHKLEGEVFSFDNHSLINIRIYVPDEDWQKVRFDLIERLGQPSSEVPNVYQNAFGAKWEYSQGFWSNKDVVVTAGIKVEEFAGEAHRNPLTNRIETSGIEISISDAHNANFPNSRPNLLD